MKTILILEDNDERIEAFQKAVAALEIGFELKVWRDDWSERWGEWNPRRMARHNVRLAAVSWLH